MKPTTTMKSVKDFFKKGKDNNKREYIRKLDQSRRSNIQAVAILESENIERRRKLLRIVQLMKTHQAKHIISALSYMCIILQKKFKSELQLFFKRFSKSDDMGI